MLDSCKMIQKQSEAFHTFLWHFFQVQNRILLHIFLLKSPHVQIAFSRVYSNCCCSCSFEPEIIKFGQSSHNMYRIKRMNFQESKLILDAHRKKFGNLSYAPRIYIYIYIYALVVLNLKYSAIRLSMYEIWERLHLHFSQFQFFYFSGKFFFNMRNWFGFVLFYGTTTIVGYLMPNPFSYL